jgi:hypothetical protein
MNVAEIEIKKKSNGKIQYLTEVLKEIPTNTILCKTLTGLGATYGEIKAKRHSIIIEPNKPVIVGKYNDSKHKDDNLFPVHEGIYSDDIVNYIENTFEYNSKHTGKNSNKYIKILTTPESFPKVKSAFEEVDYDIRFNCFLLYDECHKLVKDADYRNSISLPMDFFFECQYKAMVSATPIEINDPRFEEQGFQIIKIKPTFDYKRDINLWVTNNLLQSTKEVLAKIEDKTCFLFCNSTDTIYALMKQLNLLDKSAVFCSDKSVDKLRGLNFKSAYSTWDEKNMKHYNWLTSRFYNAVDIEINECPNVLLLTDCYMAEYTMFDPNTDIIQCAGRFRNGISSLHLISNINNHYPIWNRDELNGYIKCFKETYDNINLLYEQNRKCKMKQEAYKAILDTLPFTQFLTTDGYINYFAIDNYIDNEFIKGYYQNSVNLYRAFSDNEVFSLSSYHNNHYKLGDYERLHRENNAISLKAKRKILVKQLEILGDCSTELDLSFKEELRQVDKLIVEAYDKLGKAKIEELRYNSKKIKREIILTDYHNKARGNEAQKLLNLDFQIGAWYSAENIKSKLKQICKDLDMKPLKAVTSHTILDFFEAKPQQRGKKRGYLIIRKKFI